MDKNLNGTSELILSFYGYTDHVVLAANFFTTVRPFLQSLNGKQ